MYTIKSHQPTNLLIKDQACPAPNFAMIGFWATLIATLLIGLLGIIIWRICATFKDRREYALFEERVATMQFQEMSPIYKTPITRHNNPQFISKSKENIVSF